MRLYRILSLLIGSTLLFSLSACFEGASNDVNPIGATQAQNGGGRTHGSAIPSEIIAAINNTSTNGTGNIVAEPPAATVPVIVNGTLKADNLSGGSITLEIREAEACADGYCPVDGKAPLASTVISAPGFYSIVVPAQGQKATLVAQSGNLTGMRYLGELKARLDGMDLELK